MRVAAGVAHACGNEASSYRYVEEEQEGRLGRACLGSCVTRLLCEENRVGVDREEEESERVVMESRRQCMEKIQGKVLQRSKSKLLMLMT